jgi:integral membrane protein
LLGTPATRFRVIAVAEALSWAGLLVGMLFKYVVSENDAGVQVFGPIHGVIAILYVLAALAAWSAQRWPTRVGLLALAASLPPFGSVVFERWATRTGRLDAPPPRPVMPAPQA